MSISRCHPGLAVHSFLLAFISLAFTGFGSSAAAQAAPQLLPYTVKLIAGSGTAAIAAGATCPVSGFKSLDAYGDGCLATEIQLTTGGAKIYYGDFPGYAIADSTGAIFFSDGVNGLVRRIDPVTGVVSAIAGGASSTPGVGATCGAYTSTDANGDGCLSTAVKLNNPAALAFDAAGNLYVADVGKANIRKIAATGGVIATGGIISNVAGGSTYGYNVNNTASGPVNAATQSYVDEPFGLAFDSAGNLYVADEGEQAIEVINLTGANETLQGVTIPAGTIEKIMGYKTGADCPSFISTSSRGGCAYGVFTDGAQAMTSQVDSAYQLTVVPSTLNAPNAGYVYVANEFPDDVLQINTSNVVNNYAGVLNSAAVTQKRGTAGTFAMGSPFGVAADAYGNVYVTDASSGEIWRVDQGSKAMYVVAGGASSVCGGASDANGDGCPALQTKFGASAGSSGYAGSTPPAPGIFGISVDAYGDLFVGDTETSLIREVALGTKFGNVGASQTNTVEVHFAANDSAASGGYQITSGGSIFTLGSPSCTTNSDKTTDCLLPITATPSILGAFTGTLQVQSQLNGTATFPLSGNFVQSPVTRTAVSTANTSACSGSTSFSTASTNTLTATLVAYGPSNPTGTIIFYANGTALAPTTGVPVSNIGTAAAPVYGANLPYAFSTPGTYAITAAYSGDGYFKTSTSAAPASVTTALPAFTTSAITYQQSTVAAGQTGLYSFNVAQTVYTGTISFAISGLPANSSAVFSPATLTATGCSTTNTVALSIVTQSAASQLSAIGGGGKGIWGSLTGLAGLGMALLVGLRRRRSPLRHGNLWMALALLLAASGTVACGNGVSAVTRTPSGTYNITVTTSGSTGSTATFTIPLTVK